MLRLLLLLAVPLLSATRLCEHARFGEKCFHFVPLKAQFADAESVCQQLGGHLASIHNSEENHAVAMRAVNYIPAVRAPWFWIGGYFNNIHWEWLDGASMDFTNWKANRTQAAEEKCAAIAGMRGDWHARKCQNVAPFVCEVTAGTTILVPKH